MRNNKQFLLLQQGFFYPLGKLSAIFIKLKLVASKLLRISTSLKSCHFAKDLIISHTSPTFHEPQKDGYQNLMEKGEIKDNKILRVFADDQLND